MTEIILHGETITPMGMIDVLDIVEDEMGPDIRQYIESYMMDDDIQGDWSESDLLADQKEHYLDVLDAIDMKLAEIEQTLSGNRVGRKNLMEKIESIRKLLEREKK